MLGPPLAVTEPLPVKVSASMIAAPPEAKSGPKMTAPTGVEDVPALAASRFVPVRFVWLYNAGLNAEANVDVKGRPLPVTVSVDEKMPEVWSSGIVMFNV